MGESFSWHWTWYPLNSININTRGCPLLWTSFSFNFQLSPKIASCKYFNSLFGLESNFRRFVATISSISRIQIQIHTHTHAQTTNTYANVVSTFAARHFKTLAQSFECIFLNFLFVFFFLLPCLPAILHPQVCCFFCVGVRGKKIGKSNSKQLSCKSRSFSLPVALFPELLGGEFAFLGRFYTQNWVP